MFRSFLGSLGGLYDQLHELERLSKSNVRADHRAFSRALPLSLHPLCVHHLMYPQADVQVVRVRVELVGLQSGLGTGGLDLILARPLDADKGLLCEAPT